MRYRHLNITIIYLLIICSFFSISCGGGRISWGVVLWSENEEILQNGSLISIISKSELNNSYTIKIPDSGEKIDISQGKILEFENKEKAKEYITQYTPFFYTFAISKKKGPLPIRGEPKAASENIYRLKPGTPIKILNRSEKPIKEGNLENYWYSVLTEDGVLGYCFGHSLRVYNSQEMDASQATKITDKDMILEEFFSKNWRHTSFQETIDKGQINLDEFKVEYGLFPDAKNKLVKIKTPDHSIDLSYSGISVAGAAFYLFENTNLKIAVRSNEELFVKYTYKNKDYRETYIYLEKEQIEEYINKEIERRNSVYAGLKNKGNTLESETSGTIELKDYKKFRWSGYSNLIPGVIPSDIGNSGTIEFPLFLSRDLRRYYRGVISFHFNNTPQKSYIHFLYNVTEDGMELVYSPEKYIDKGVVQEESPLSEQFIFSYSIKSELEENDKSDENSIDTENNSE